MAGKVTDFRQDLAIVAAQLQAAVTGLTHRSVQLAGSFRCFPSSVRFDPAGKIWAAL
jgi:hypothetical protein